MIKILCIDGGGVRGLIPALVLAEIESLTDQPIADSFDLIVGTSTGGILALGLTSDDGYGCPLYSAQDIVDFYRSYSPDIFQNTLFSRISSVNGLFDNNYEADGLESVLADFFGDAVLGNSLTYTMVTSYDIQNREVVLLQSWDENYSELEVLTVARATSAAPSYFEPVVVSIENKRRVLIDGGIFANNPALTALTEAMKLFPDESDFFVVSLGTGYIEESYSYEDSQGWGRVEWVSPLFECIFDSISESINHQVSQFIGDNFVRLDTFLFYSSVDLDDASEENLDNLYADAQLLIQNQYAVLQRISDIIIYDDDNLDDVV
ncbi:MAG: patatin-like phospholipase family protein [Gammaproteobacteria bacterium]|nr:patatin-like phospholipase family protein [Gammaproteobacteria bacterium]